MVTEQARLCRCGCNVVLLPQWLSDYATYECMACVRRDSASMRANPVLMKPPDYASAAYLQRKDQAPDSPWLLPGTMPSPQPPIDFPSRHVEITRHWERRDEGLIDPATIPLESEDGTPEDFYPKAVSWAQAFWARGELAKAKRGGHTKLSISELKALANTPLAGLPERAGRRPQQRSCQPRRRRKEKRLRERKKRDQGITSTELQAFMSEPINWREFKEVTVALLDERGGEEMPRHTHSPRVRKRPTPQPIKRPVKARP